MAKERGLFVMEGRGELAKRLLWLSCVLVTLFFILFPIYMLLKYSISDITTINTDGAPIPLWPNEISFANFGYILGGRGFWKVVTNSLIISLFSVVLTMLMGVPAGYVMARYNFPFKKLFPILLISIRLFPDIASVIPVVEFFIRMNIHSNHLAVILAHTLLALPYVILIATSAFEFVPKDIEEQACVIGASRGRIFFQILLPVVFPSIVAGAIYTFLLSWNEFIFAHFLLGTGGNVQTLTLYLKGQSLALTHNLLATISVCLSIPVIIFTFIIQRYMVTGASAGAVK